MEWRDGVLLAAGTLAITLAVRNVWHGYRWPACRAARRVVRDRHPDWRLCGSTHRATEPGRDVVAVFHQQLGLRHRPTPYRLVVVDRGAGAAEVLPDDPGSPYAFKNYR